MGHGRMEEGRKHVKLSTNKEDDMRIRLIISKEGTSISRLSLRKLLILNYNIFEDSRLLE